MNIFSHTKMRGFTLVEVIIAISIIAILSMVVIASVQEGRKKSHDTQRMSDITQLQLALRLYKDSNNGYPSDAAYASGIVFGEGGALDTELASYVSPGMRDPNGSVTDTTYEYVYDTNFDCSIAGAGKKVLYAKTVEREATANWEEVCGTAVPGSTATYGVILQ